MLVLIFFIHDSMVISTDEWVVRVCQPPVQYLSKFLSMCLCDDLCVYTCHGTDTKPIIFVTVLEWVRGPSYFTQRNLFVKCMHVFETRCMHVCNL